MSSMKIIHMLSIVFFLIPNISFSQTFVESGTVQQIYFIDSTNGFIAGNYLSGIESYGQILKTTDCGLTWNSKINYHNAIAFFGLKFFPGGVGYVAMETYSGGTVLRSTDYGESWDSTLQIYNTWNRPRGLSFIDDKNGWSITIDSIYHTTDGGISWEKNSLGIPFSYQMDIFFIDKTLGFLCGGKTDTVAYNLVSHIYKTTDGGNNWKLVFEEEEKPENMYAGIYKLHFKNQLGIGVGQRDTATLFITTDQGETWETKSVKDQYNAYGSLNDGKIINDSVIISVGNENQIALSYDYGNNWILNYNWSSGSLLFCVYFLNNEIGWAAGTGINGFSNYGAYIIKTTDGGLTWTTLVITNIKEKSQNLINFSLSQNYPNPFNPTTKIKYQVPHAGFVSLKVYDLLGREVATLVNEENAAGSYEVEFDGSEISSGVYFYRLQSGSFVKTKKLILMR